VIGPCPDGIFELWSACKIPSRTRNFLLWTNRVGRQLGNRAWISARIVHLRLPNVGGLPNSSASARPRTTIRSFSPSVQFAFMICAGFQGLSTTTLLDPAVLLPCPPSRFSTVQVYHVARLLKIAHATTSMQITQ
jgi:hypothetical protein